MYMVTVFKKDWSTVSYSFESEERAIEFIDRKIIEKDIIRYEYFVDGSLVNHLWFI